MDFDQNKICHRHQIQMQFLERKYPQIYMNCNLKDQIDTMPWLV